MFCEKCGTKLPDDAVFCANCGNKIGGGENKPKEKIDDKEVILNVKPTYKVGYMILPYLFTFLLILICMGLPMFLGDPEVGLIVSVGILIVMAIIYGISYLFNKKQYDNYTYDFYKTKVNYKDSFLNVSEKEVKYKYIREVTMRQTFIQRFFNIGTIILFTNAETGIGNGICIVNVENVQEVYKKIKDVIDV